MITVGDEELQSLEFIVLQYPALSCLLVLYSYKYSHILFSSLIGLIIKYPSNKNVLDLD
jgi:hypothetical protein